MGFELKKCLLMCSKVRGLSVSGFCNSNFKPGLAFFWKPNPPLYYSTITNPEDWK